MTPSACLFAVVGLGLDEARAGGKRTREEEER